MQCLAGSYSMKVDVFGSVLKGEMPELPTEFIIDARAAKLLGVSVYGPCEAAINYRDNGMVL